MRGDETRGKEIHYEKMKRGKIAEWKNMERRMGGDERRASEVMRKL